MRFIIFALLFITSIHAEGATLKLRDFSPAEGKLSNSNVSCMLQDREGYLWIGTWDGLNRYDGFEILAFRNVNDDPGSISSNIITGLSQDRNGNIWVANAKGISKYIKDEKRFQNFELELPLPVRCLHTDSKNNLWIGTDNGVFSYSIKDNTMRHFPLLKETAVRVNHVESDSDGTLFIGSSKGVFLSSRTEPRFIQFINTFTESEGASNITALTHKGDSLYLTTYWGAYGFDVQKRIFFSLGDKTTGGYFRDIKFHNDKLWILTGENEIYSFEPQSGIERLLISKEINTVARFLFFDYTGVMWISFNQEGLKSVPHQQPFRNNIEIELGNTSVNGFSSNCFYPYKDSLYWIGSDKGLLLYDIINARVVNHFFEEYIIRRITGDSSGNIWVGTLSNGLLNAQYRAHAHDFIVKNHYNRSLGFTTNVVFSLFVDSNRNIWAGSYESFYVKKKDSTSFSQVMVHLDDTIISKLQVWDVFEDKEGRIWIGTQRNGLVQYSPETTKFTQFIYDKKQNTISSNAVKAIMQDGDKLLIGTEGGGLNILALSTGKFMAFTEADGLINNTVWSILKKGEDNYWISTNAGLMNYKKEKFYNYTRADGLAFIEFNPNSSRNIGDTLFLFGGNRGFIGFDTMEIQPRNFNPKAAIQEVMVNDVPRYPTFREEEGAYYLNLSPETYNLLIKFTVFEFSSPEKVKYKFKLENNSSIRENSTNSDMIATFYNVPPGDYIFSLESSLDGITWHSFPQILKLNIASYWYKSLPALFVYILLLISGIFLYVLITGKRKKRLSNISQNGNSAFTQKAEKIILEHLDDTTFSVEKLAAELGLSRSSLHKRLKSNTGKSAGELIRDIRLTTAYELLSESNISVKEVSFRCGFSDSSYFTKCFKQKYGKPPTAMDK